MTMITGIFRDLLFKNVIELADNNFVRNSLKILRIYLCKIIEISLRI